MKFLKFVVDYENQTDVWHPYADSPLAIFLSSQFQLPLNIQDVITALTLSLNSLDGIKVAWALPRIATHLTSIGVFGPGFGAVVPKWGGGAEIAQVACRAGAVGGGIYILGTGVDYTKTVTEDGIQLIQSGLSNGEAVRSRHFIGNSSSVREPNNSVASKAIAIVSSPLASLFKSSVEGSPLAAVSVIVLPASTIFINGATQSNPVYIMAHSSETGECPVGQCKWTFSLSLFSCCVT